MRMDPLSSVLRQVRLTGGVFLDARFTAPWCIASRISAEDCRPFLTTPSQVIAYHVVIDGRLLLATSGEPAVEIGAGEIVLLPRNDDHTLASAPGLPPVDAEELIEPSPDGGLARIAHGGGGEETRIICGFLGSEQVSNPLIESLPRVLKLDIRRGASRDWIEASVKFAAQELADGRVATSSVMSRLSELLFVEAVRHYASGMGQEGAGWLRGLADPCVGRALALIHADLSAPWTTERLANAVAASRSAFVDRFTSLVGLPPIRYLAHWRLETARVELRETGRSVAEVAFSVGYASEEAFSRAFKRKFGVSPAGSRKARGEAAQ